MPESTVIVTGESDDNGSGSDGTAAAVAANDAEHAAESAESAAEESGEAAEGAENAADVAEDAAGAAVNGAVTASGAAAEATEALSVMERIAAELPGRIATAVRDALQPDTTVESSEPTQEEITSEDEAPRGHWWFRPMWGKRA